MLKTARGRITLRKISIIRALSGTVALLFRVSQGLRRPVNTSLVNIDY
jgi:hypothetical protein